MTNARKLSNFLTDIVEADLARGTNGQKVVTRFPPEPNGFLHIGHAKSILLNFGLAAQYSGKTNLRFDDTNPTTEDTLFVESIEKDVQWLGCDWGSHLHFASDSFEKMFECGLRLVRDAKAYVDSQPVEAIREQRGSFERPGVDSPFRTRSIEENVSLFQKMREGVLPDGAAVLRAKIDMAHPNVIMRDPLLYRIRHAHHHRTLDRWCIYPMYDFAHPLEDGFEGITHSICTLEFESNRELYDWVLDNLGPWNPRPRQYEFARLALGYTVMSKRKLLQLVNEKRVSGWDDPRMPTIAGMRRRGVTPEALRDFADLIGVAKNNSLVDIGKFEFAIRGDLERRAPRALAVLNPLKVRLTNWPQGKVEELNLPWWPGEPARGGTRRVPFGGELLIEREDFAQTAPKGWKRLALGGETRLMGAYVIRCHDVLRDASGEIAELLCTYDADSAGGNPKDSRKIPGTLHWVHEASSAPAEVRLYDRLFNVEQPDAEGDFLQHLNPHSLKKLGSARLEPALRDAAVGTHFQFVRQGYFFTDPVDSSPGAPVFNRTLGLRDTWLKPAEAVEERKMETAAPEQKLKLPKKDAAGVLAELESRSPALAACFRRYQKELGLKPDEAELLVSDEHLSAYFDSALAVHGNAGAVAKWLSNELLGLLGGSPLASSRLSAEDFGRFVALVDADLLTPTAGKALLADLVANGGDPQARMHALKLERVDNPGALDAALERVFEVHAAEVARYLAGEKKLLGVLVGAVMKETQGAADAGSVRKALAARLG